MHNKFNKTNYSSQELLLLEANYCSHGDTVHYSDSPKIFEKCEGSFIYDDLGQKFLDLQMWYSAVNFGYANPRLNNALKKQIDSLPQVASQYLHKEKILLASKIAIDAEKKFGEKGRVHFNVGGSQAVEDSLKLVRNAKNGKSLMFAFEGGYHGRTLGASAITSSYRYRRRYGHFGDRAQFIPFPYCFRCPYGKKRETCNLYCVEQFARLFETEYYGIWDSKNKTCEYAAFYIEPIQGTGGYVIPPEGYFERLNEILKEHGVLTVVDEIQMGVFRTGKLWSIEHFNINPDVLVFGKAITNGLNPLSGIWAKEDLINPTLFPPGSTHSTFNANSLGTAVALEVFNMIEDENFELKIKEKGTLFLNGLKDLKKKYRFIGDVDGLGMALRIEICEPHDSFTPSKSIVDKMVDKAMLADLEFNGEKYGLVLDIGGYYKNVITLAPSLNMSNNEINLALNLLDNLFMQISRMI